MFCRNCGKQLPEFGKFCPECGTDIPDLNALNPAPQLVGESTMQDPNSLQRPTAQPLRTEQFPQPISYTPSYQPSTAEPVGAVFYNGAILTKREILLIKITAITLIVFAVSTVICQMFFAAVLQSEEMFSSPMGAITAIVFGISQFKCKRWAFLLPALGRAIDIFLIMSDLISVFSADWLMPAIAENPAFLGLIVVECFQLVISIVLLVLLFIAQLPLSAKQQNQRSL